MQLKQLDLKTLEDMATVFFQKSEGEWTSQRRYYTLKQDMAQEVLKLEKTPQEAVSELKVRFLEQGSPELKKLEGMHGLTKELKGGSEVFWHSKEAIEGGKNISKGSTIFGVLGENLYRDRGFATSKPIIARYRFSEETTLILRTEYDGSVFEEDIKLIGDLYRTRQTIISRAQEELMIIYSLEKRLK